MPPERGGRSDETGRRTPESATRAPASEGIATPSPVALRRIRRLPEHLPGSTCRQQRAPCFHLVHGARAIRIGCAENDAAVHQQRKRLRVSTTAMRRSAATLGDRLRRFPSRSRRGHAVLVARCAPPPRPSARRPWSSRSNRACRSTSSCIVAARPSSPAPAPRPARTDDRRRRSCRWRAVPVNRHPSATAMPPCA